MEIRELDGEMEYASEERDLLAQHEISIDTLRDFLRTSGPQNLDTAIGGILALKAGKGQERNEKFQTQAEADAQVSQSSNSEIAAS